MKEKKRIEKMFSLLDRAEAGMKSHLEVIARLNADIDNLMTNLRLDPSEVRAEAKKSGCSLAQTIALKLGFTESEFNVLVKR